MTQNAKRILIVDDEAPLRFLLSKQLTRAGFETLTAADGPAALAVAAESPVDAVVLDVVMPGMDGFEVCRRLKADPLTAGVPVLFLSASISGDFRRRAFHVGGAEFLAKPFQIEELPAYLRAILGDGAPADRPTPTGRVVSVIGPDRAAGSAAAAVRLAESEALGGHCPVMLIDLELPAGAIGARLQLAGGPNVRVLLQDTGEAVSREAIGYVAQRLHFGMEVIPAPFAPSALGQGEPDARRLSDTLDLLTAAGYLVVLHLGPRPDELTATALHRSQLVYTVTGAGVEQREAWQAALVARGVAREHITALGEVTGEATNGRTRAPESAPTRARPRPAGRVPEPALAH